MHRCPFRACLSLLLVFVLLSMVGPRAAMAMPMEVQGAAHQMHMLHGHLQMMDEMSSQHAVSYNGQHGYPDKCCCGAQCGLCGVCHSIVTGEAVSGFIGTPVIPAGSVLLNLAELWLPLDPRPPRA